MALKRNKRIPASMAITQAIIHEYQPKNTEEMQEAIKDIMGIWIGEFEKGGRKL